MRPIRANRRVAQPSGMFDNQSVHRVDVTFVGRAPARQIKRPE
jgi:hypothetical protein